MVEYTIRVSKRARRVGILVDRSDGLVLRLPSLDELGLGEKFIREKSSWILRQFRLLGRNRRQAADWIQIKTSDREYALVKEAARRTFSSRLVELNRSYGFSYAAVRVRNQQTLWGSCARSGNIQLHYKLHFLPDELRDYVLVHELCHLKEHNHGPRFWSLVSQSFPQYRQLRKQLRRYKFRKTP